MFWRGWISGSVYREQDLGSEAMALRFGFHELNLHRDGWRFEVIP